MRNSGEPQRNQDSNRGLPGEVCVIGAGFSGLAVARALRSRNVPFACFDRGVDLGGVWCFTGGSESERSPAYRSLHLNTSGAVTSFSGFPMPASYPPYPRHDEVAAYLRDFADHHGLTRHIECRTEVTAIRAEPDGTWRVTARDRTGGENHRRFSHVVVASGYQWEPRLPDPAITGSDSFNGEIIHSADYVDPAPYSGKRVLVLGFGNSACDIAVELSRVAEKTTLACRRGAHVVPKQLMGIPIDEIAASRWWSWLPFPLQRKLIEVLLRIIRGPITSYGIPEPDHRVLEAPVTISDELLSRIRHGAVAVKPMIDHFGSARVHFADGTADAVDAVIFCTGYRVSFPFVPPDSVFSRSGQVALYQRVLPPHHPGLYFAGLIRPVGAITYLVEQQAEWIAELIAGEAAVPSTDDMASEIHTHLDRAAHRYGTAAIDSIHVDVPTYLRAIRRERKASRHRRRARPNSATRRSRREKRVPA
ncbi:flavin-containing monooxygenase [Saccharopolyspora sp. 5N708]|uniref:flavin-containing monooxygenase n=1 Tax=Saccharopolyspora sp. 5N708 TaxID=3457424 RepID=UPI003FD1E39D